MSSCELLELYLLRIGRYNATYNAVIALDIEAARNMAQAVDDQRARGQELGPLAGLPMTIKDSFEVTGMATVCGLPPLANYHAERDADAVERLRASGAVVFGKTNVPAGLCDWQTDNPVYGLTRNPWNPERTAGGSSGGSTAALAAGFTALELGSDFAGSNRLPAHFCGVFGHRASYGIIPFRGHIPPMPGSLRPPEMAVVGPLARSAADLRLALAVLTGPGVPASTAWRLALPGSRHERLADFRVAVWTGAGSYRVDEGYLETIEAFVEGLRPTVGSVTRAAPPFDIVDDYDLYLKTVFAIVGRHWPIGLDDPGCDPVLPDARDYAARARRYVDATFAEWSILLDRREQLAQAFREFFRSYDVLLCPAAMGVAFRHDTDGPQLLRSITVSGRPQAYLDNFAWPSIAAVASLPVTVMPTGRLVEGLPAGVQIIGPALEDHTTLRFAELVETQTGGFVAPPAVLMD
jgi:amidase